MYPKILIITTQYSLQNISKLQELFKKKCKLDIKSYQNLDEAINIYKQLNKDYDGFMFSGWLPYSIIMGLDEFSNKPHSFFNISEGDFYKAILKVIINNPKLDFNRILIDDPQIDIDYSDIFPAGKSLVVNSFSPLEYAMQEASSMKFYSPSISAAKLNIYDLAMESYRSLLRLNKIDVVVTRFASLSSILEKEKIPYYIMSPSVTTMSDTMDKLINTINSGIYTGMLTAYATIKANNMSPLLMGEIRKVLIDYKRHSGINLFISEQEDYFEIYTSNKILRLVTNEMTGCNLTKFLKKNISEPLYIGWGVGYDVIQAADNSKRASTLSVNNSNKTYIVDETGAEIGPLSEDCRLINRSYSTEYIQSISLKYKLPDMTVIKLLNIISQYPNQYFTSESLSDSLNMSQRNARRILSILVENGGAKCVGYSTTHSKGRPSPKYRIEL